MKNQKIKVKNRYLAYLVNASNEFELDQKNLFQIIRKEFTLLYGLIDFSKSYFKVIELNNKLLIVSVSNKHLGKLVSTTALMKQLRLIPFSCSGTLKKLKKKIENYKKIISY